MYCMNCGTALPDDANFCNKCGAAQEPMTKATPVFRSEPKPTMDNSTASSGPYTICFNNQSGEKDLINRVNSWLAANPTFGNISCQFSTGSSLGFFTNHTTLSNVTLQYYDLGGTNHYVYQLEHAVWFGFYSKDTNKLLAEWEQEHPNAVVLKASGSTNSRGSSGSLLFGGIGASNEVAVYVFYKQRRATMQEGCK